MLGFPPRSWALCVLVLACVAWGAPHVVQVNWTASAPVVSRLRPTLQVVPNPMSYRGSPVHDAVWGALGALEADMVRLQLWLPYPRMSVAALEPPSGGALCGFLRGDSAAFNNFTLDCGGANGSSSIASVDFVAFGASSGYCGGLVAGGCSAPGARAAVEAACLGRRACTVVGVAAWMAGAASCGRPPSTAVQVTCSAPAQGHTYWDFSRMDGVVADFMGASGGRPVVVDFSTPPQWLYETPDRVAYPDDPQGETWSYEQGTALRDPSGAAIAGYYARLLAWYTDGGFEDELGAFHASGHYYNFSVWEYLNEMEHGLSPEDYTLQYDAVLLEQRRLAPRGSAGLQYMGLALEQDDDVRTYLSYFLNASNHAPGVPPADYISFHYYAGAVTRSDAPGYELAFGGIDAFMPQVALAVALRDALSPSTRLDMDEAGVILPDDNDAQWTGGAPGFPPIYWNAVAASFAYRFALLAVAGVDFLGDSALAQIPNMTAARGEAWGPQYPSVTMLDWETGAPSARYWVLKLLLEQTSVGMGLLPTSVAPAVENPFCASAVNLGDASGAVVALACAPGAGVIDAVLFASYGTPLGACPGWTDGACAAANASAIVSALCVGKTSCTVAAADGGLFGDPCFGTVKTLAIVARCIAAPGGAQEPTAGGAAPIFAQGLADAAGAPRRLLLVSKSSQSQAAAVAGSAGGSWTWVDESTAAAGPPATTLVPANETLQLAPFAVGILTMPPVPDTDYGLQKKRRSGPYSLLPLKN